MPLATADAVRETLNPDGGDGDLGSAASMSTPQLDVACSEADTEVIGRVFQRYPQLPDPAPAQLVSIAVDIAAYLATLTARRGDPLLPGHPVLLRYQRAQQLLAQIVAGSMVLVDVETVDSAAASDPASANPFDGNLFSPRDVGMTKGIDGSWQPAGSYPRGWPGSSGIPYGESW